MRKQRDDRASSAATWWRSLAAGGALLALPALGCNGDPRPATWSYLSPAIFQPSCATVSCHSRAAAVAGLDFSDPDRGYASLTALTIWIVDPDGTADGGCRPANGTIICERPHRPVVVPYDPAESRLVNMLRARGATRMPPDRPLPEADITLVERWILDGARRMPDGPAAPTDPYADAGADGQDAGDGAMTDAKGADGAKTDGAKTDGAKTDGAMADASDGGDARPADASDGDAADADGSSQD